MSDDKIGKAIEHDILLEQLMDSRIPKNDHEHCAVREITRLNFQLAAVTQELEQAKADLARQVKLNEHFACNTCGGIGVVGNAPDDYYDCPDCKSYDDMKAELEQAVFEREKAYRARDSLARQYGNLSTDYHNLKVKSFKSFNDDECWIYQGDESDNLESLICPVVISAKDLIQLKQSSVVMPEDVIKSAFHFGRNFGDKDLLTATAAYNDWLSGIRQALATNDKEKDGRSVFWVSILNINMAFVQILPISDKDQ